MDYTVGGTATLDIDYTGITVTPDTKMAILTAGSATATVMVDPTVDKTIEGDETVALTLAAGSMYSIGTNGAAVGTISNDDAANNVPTALAPRYQRASNSEIEDYVLLTINGYRQTFKDAESYAINAAIALYADNDFLYSYYYGLIAKEKIKAEDYFNGLVELTSFFLADVGIDDGRSLHLSPWAFNILLDYTKNYQIGYGDNVDEMNDEILGSDWSGYTVFYYDEIDKIRITDDVEIIGIDLAGGDDTLIGGDGIEIVNGGLGDDILLGMGGTDVLDGSEGSDVLEGGSGDDFIDGGSGNEDFSKYMGNENEYAVQILDNGVVKVSDIIANRDGTDAVVNIEFLWFNDKQIRLSDILKPPNSSPVDLLISRNLMDENITAGSALATLSSADPDSSDTFSYTLVIGKGDLDNAAFSINGNQLTIKASPDFETKSSYSLRIRTTDQGGLFFERAVTITVNDLNEAPIALTLSASSINENVAAGTVVATLTTTDPDGANTFSYSLASGSGDSDNNAFSITGNQLAIKASPNFESKSSYSLRIRTTDQGGLFFDRAVTLSVNDLNEAPATTATITRVNDNAGSIRGTIAPAGRSDDRTPTITGTLSAPLAAGETLRIYNGKALLGTAKVNNTARTWSYTPAALPRTSGTTHSFTALIADAAGNLGRASAARTFVLDTTAATTTATITRVNDNTSPIRGTVAPGGRSDDRTPTITGTLSAPLAAGETLRLYNGKALLGTAKVNNRARTWSYTPDALPTTTGTTYSFTARVADAAGNLGRASAARKVVLDTTAPRAVAFSPRDGAIAVELNANLSLSFSEAIRRGSGVIQLRTGSATGAIRERFDAATSTRLRISGDRLSVDPSRNLLPNTRYVLTIPAGSITDRAGNRFSGSTSYDLRTIHAVSGNASSNVLPFSSTVDRLTGLGGRDTFRLSSLNQALLPAAANTPIDRITDLASGIDRIDAPVARPIAQALNPVNLGAVADLRAASIAALLTPENFPALSTTSTGGAASFSYADPQAGPRTFLAINNAAAGFSAATDAILEISGFSGNLNQLQVF